MAEKLDKETIRELLVKADRKWFSLHEAGFNYQEHINFTAGYIVSQYHRAARRSKKEREVNG